jgi:hypothetical protein
MQPAKQIIEAVQDLHTPRHLANLVDIRGTAHEHRIEDYRASSDVEKLDDSPAAMLSRALPAS